MLAAPLNFLHHTFWLVNDLDEGSPGRSPCSLGGAGAGGGARAHYVGSNFFWYLKDPAGQFAQYYADMDCIVYDQLWTRKTSNGARGLFVWGPPPPPSFLHPST